MNLVVHWLERSSQMFEYVDVQAVTYDLSQWSVTWMEHDWKSGDKEVWEKIYKQTSLNGQRIQKYLCLM